MLILKLLWIKQMLLRKCKAIFWQLMVQSKAAALTDDTCSDSSRIMCRTRLVMLPMANSAPSGRAAGKLPNQSIQCGRSALATHLSASLPVTCCPLIGHPPPEPRHHCVDSWIRRFSVILLFVCQSRGSLPLFCAVGACKIRPADHARS